MFSNSAFFDTHIEILQQKNILGVILVLFANFEPERTQNVSKNQNKIFQMRSEETIFSKYSDFGQASW
jgi:hypothetical protein